MTYNVFSGTLNPTQSINQSITHPNFTNFRVRVTVAVDRNPFDDNAIHYVLPVVPITGHAIGDVYQ